MADERQKTNSPILAPVLEAPPAGESPSAGAGSLFSDEAIAQNASKLMVVETLLGLVTRDLKFHEFAREILLVVMKVVRSEAGSLLEVDHKNQSLFFRAVVGQSSDRVSRFLIPIGQGVVGHVAESRQPLIVNDVDQNKIFLKSVQHAVGFKAVNLVALPIIIRGRVFGVLELLNHLGEGGYTQDDVDLLTYVCGMVAKAIETRLMIAYSGRQAAAGSSGASGGQAA